MARSWLRCAEGDLGYMGCSVIFGLLSLLCGYPRLVSPSLDSWVVGEDDGEVWKLGGECVVRIIGWKWALCGVQMTGDSWVVSGCVFLGSRSAQGKGSSRLLGCGNSLVFSPVFLLSSSLV